MYVDNATTILRIPSSSRNLADSFSSTVGVEGFDKTGPTKAVRFDLEATQYHTIPNVEDEESDHVWFNKEEQVKMMEQVNQDARKCARMSRQVLRRMHKESTLESDDDSSASPHRTKLVELHDEVGTGMTDILGLERTLANAVMDVGMRRLALQKQVEAAEVQREEMHKLSKPSVVFAREMGMALSLAMSKCC